MILGMILAANTTHPMFVFPTRLVSGAKGSYPKLSAGHPIGSVSLFYTSVSHFK